jgi:ribosomal protein L44E
MKIPKETKRFCPHCKKRTDQKIKSVGTGFSRGAMRRFGGKARAKLRGIGVGIGNLGKWSKPAISKNKRKSKTTKKTNIMYTCKVCGKSKYQKKGQRAGKVVQE